MRSTLAALFPTGTASWKPGTLLSAKTRVWVPPLSTYLIRLIPPGTVNFFAWNFSSGSASTSSVLIALPGGLDEPGARLALRLAGPEDE